VFILTFYSILNQLISMLLSIARGTQFLFFVSSIMTYLAVHPILSSYRIEFLIWWLWNSHRRFSLSIHSIIPMLFLGFRFESKKNDYRVSKVNTTKGNMVMSHHMVPLAGGPTFSGHCLFMS
jgi:hypothetical protein